MADEDLIAEARRAVKRALLVFSDGSHEWDDAKVDAALEGYAERLKRERDEARLNYEAERVLHRSVHDVAQTALVERDEARAEVERLREYRADTVAIAEQETKALRADLAEAVAALREGLEFSGGAWQEQAARIVREYDEENGLNG